MPAGSKQEHHRHRIEHHNERQREHSDRSFKVGGWHTDELGEISNGSDIGLGAPALGVNPGFADLEVCKRVCLTLARCNDIGTIAALLVSDRHCANRAAKPRRFFNRCVDLGDAPIEVGHGLG